MAAWLDEIVSEEKLLLPGHSACAGCGPAINIRHVLGGLAAAKTGVEDRPRDPGLVLDDHRRRLPRQRVRRLRPADAVRLGCGGGVGDQGRAAAARPRGHDRRRLGRRRLDRRHRLLRRVGGGRAERGHRLRPQRQRGVHEHRRPEVRRDPGGRVDDDDAGGLAEGRQEEGHRADHGGARDPLRRDARRGVGADAEGLQGEGRRGPPRCAASASCTSWAAARPAGGTRRRSPPRWRGWRSSRGTSRWSNATTATWRITFRPKHVVPVREFLETQGRFGHLSPAEIDAIQAHVDERWELLEKL